MADCSQSTMDNPLPSTDHLERFGVLFGAPIAHSLSPLFHQTIFDDLDLKWSQLFLESTDMSHLLTLFKDERFFGTTDQDPVFSRAWS